jgi:hypothetical protein
MNYYCQQAYPGNLGSSPYTIARYGCLTTCLGEIAEFVYPGTVSNPSQTAKKLQYTQEGYVIWSSLSNIGLKLVSTITRSLGSPALADTIRAGLKDPSTYVVLEINNGSHFVFALGVSLLGGYTIADPWNGKRTTTRDYRNNVTGCRIISHV